MQELQGVYKGHAGWLEGTVQWKLPYPDTQTLDRLFEFIPTCDALCEALMPSAPVNMGDSIVF